MFQPLEDKVVIKPLEEDGVSKGGLLLTESTKLKGGQGTVVAVGPGRVLESGTQITPKVSVGDVVIYQTYSMADIRIEDQMYHIVRESEIASILKQ